MENRYPDPPTLAFFFLEKTKTTRETPKKARVFLFAENLNPWKTEKKGKCSPKKQGKSEKKTTRKSKRARVGGSGKIGILGVLKGGGP